MSLLSTTTSVVYRYLLETKLGDVADGLEATACALLTPDVRFRDGPDAVAAAGATTAVVAAAAAAAVVPADSDAEDVEFEASVAMALGLYARDPAEDADDDRLLLTKRSSIAEVSLGSHVGHLNPFGSTPVRSSRRAFFTPLSSKNLSPIFAKSM